LKFHGFIDDIDMAGDNTIKISCRDQGGELQDTYIESVVTRGSGGGTAVQTVMQTIVTAAMASPPTIYVPSSPGWNILEFEQTKEPLFTAIRRLADQIGWILKYWWDSGTSAYRLTLYEPDRTVAVAMRTFGPGEYFKISKASMSRKSVRNRVVVSYRTSPEGALLDVTVNDAGSQSKYGLRYCGVTEGATSNIDSSGEATTMANAILTDLKEPTLSHTVTMPLFWPAETGDYYGFTDNHVIYDTTQNLAVFAITHKFTAGGKVETTLQLRGKPASGSRRWLNVETRPGIAPPVINRTSAAATGLATVQGAGGSIVLTYDDPRSMTPPVRTWATTKLYVSTTPGFTPGPSNLVAQNKSTRFVIENLVSGTTYYAKIQIIDGSGNVSTTSAQETIVAGYTGALHLNRDNEFGNIILNPTVSNWSSPRTQADNPPDNWEACYIASGVSDVTILADSFWNDSGSSTERLYYDNSTIKSADVSVEIYGDGGSSYADFGICSKLVPCAGDTVYKATMDGWTRFVSNGIRAILFLYDSSKTFLERVSLTATTLGASSWTSWYIYHRSHASARYARICTYVSPNGAAGAGASLAYLDRVTLQRSVSSFRAQTTSATVCATGVFTAVTIDNEIYDYGVEYNDTTSQFVAQDEGLYSFEAVVELDGLGHGKSMQIALYLNLGAGLVVYTKSIIAENNSGIARDTVATVATKPIQMYPGAIAEVRVWHNHGGNLNTLTGKNTQFSGERLV
jgi:hypothetical protein